MAWLDPSVTPVYHVTSNHNTYDGESEHVWREVFPNLPKNGPKGQEGLSYWVRRGNVLIVACNTDFSGLGGGGHVECEWLDEVLAANADVGIKLVAGHHPVHAVNGYDTPACWIVEPSEGRAFWDVCTKHKVNAYLCSHVIAFDVQVHHGVLQITSGGAGTKAGPGDFMPGNTEYHHVVQAAADARGLRYQVLGTEGDVKEWLSWPFAAPQPAAWQALPVGVTEFAPKPKALARDARDAAILLWRFAGTCSRQGRSAEQTLLGAWDASSGQRPIWIGMEGAPPRIIVALTSNSTGASQRWWGPTLVPDEPLDFQIAIHTGMGPGGIMFRHTEGGSWSSLLPTDSAPYRGDGATLAACAPFGWGAEQIAWPTHCASGRGSGEVDDRPFLGKGLRVTWAVVESTLEN